MSVELFALTRSAADDSLEIHTVRLVRAGDEPDAIGLFTVSRPISLDVETWIGQAIESGRFSSLRTDDGSEWRLAPAGPETISVCVPSGWDMVETSVED
jgi:hypothetical protein